MRTNSSKAQLAVGSLLLFVLASAITVTVMITTSAITANQIGKLRIGDESTSAMMLAEGIVNSPECLLYTETDDNGNLVYTKDVIDWDKVENIQDEILPLSCPKKGPYTYIIRIETSDGKVVELMDEWWQKGLPVSGVSDVPDFGISKTVGVEKNGRIEPAIIGIFLRSFEIDTEVGCSENGCTVKGTYADRLKTNSGCEIWAEWILPDGTTSHLGINDQVSLSYENECSESILVRRDELGAQSNLYKTLSIKATPKFEQGRGDMRDSYTEVTKATII